MRANVDEDARAAADDEAGTETVAAAAANDGDDGLGSCGAAADEDDGPFTWIRILSTSKGDVQERVTQPATRPATTDSTPLEEEEAEDDGGGG